MQEQNSYAGLTNKLLAKKAMTICVAYQGMEKFFPKDKIVLTGNPVRTDILNSVAKKKQALAHFGLNPNLKTILIIGGSQASLFFSKKLKNEIIDLASKYEIEVTQQLSSGFDIENYKIEYDENSIKNNLFFFEMCSLQICAPGPLKMSSASENHSNTSNIEVH